MILFIATLGDMITPLWNVNRPLAVSNAVIFSPLLKNWRPQAALSPITQGELLFDMAALPWNCFKVDLAGPQIKQEALPHTDRHLQKSEYQGEILSWYIPLIVSVYPLYTQLRPLPRCCLEAISPLRPTAEFLYVKRTRTHTHWHKQKHTFRDTRPAVQNLLLHLLPSGTTSHGCSDSTPSGTRQLTRLCTIGQLGAKTRPLLAVCWAGWVGGGEKSTRGELLAGSGGLGQEGCCTLITGSWHQWCWWRERGRTKQGSGWRRPQQCLAALGVSLRLTA